MRLLLVRAPLLCEDLEASLLLAGATVWVRSPVELSESNLTLAKSNSVRTVLSINHSPELALLCSVVGLRYLSWTIDPLPHRRWNILPGTKLDDTYLFVHRKILVDPLQRMGYRHVEWMPLACASRRLSNQVSAGSRTGSALFVGSSLEDERGILIDALRRWGLSETLPGMDQMLQGLARACLWDRSFFGFLRQPQAIPASLREAVPQVKPEDLAEALDAGLAWHFRRELVKQLSVSGCEVKGDGGWKSLAGSR